ncbi:hypothetical protein F5Y16DRAFT_114408 [Xylariaceae sp. FL0255]|nr:hypothetical protein F5Y16DRAFT_114408 [Xylariaceae sp. FL0255]
MVSHQFSYICETDALPELTLMACDNLDQVEDGIISQPDACLAHFDPFQLVGMPINCTQTNGTVHISQAAAALVSETWHGPSVADETKLWYGMNPGVDIPGYHQQHPECPLQRQIVPGLLVLTLLIYLGHEHLFFRRTRLLINVLHTRRMGSFVPFKFAAI